MSMEYDKDCFKFTCVHSHVQQPLVWDTSAHTHIVALMLDCDQAHKQTTHVHRAHNGIASRFGKLYGRWITVYLISINTFANWFFIVSNCIFSRSHQNELCIASVCLCALANCVWTSTTGRSDCVPSSLLYLSISNRTTSELIQSEKYIICVVLMVGCEQSPTGNRLPMKMHIISLSVRWKALVLLLPNPNNANKNIFTCLYDNTFYAPWTRTGCSARKYEFEYDSASAPSVWLVYCVLRVIVR